MSWGHSVQQGKTKTLWMVAQKFYFHKWCKSNKGNWLSVWDYIGCHGGHVNLDVVHRSRLTPIKQRLMVMEEMWILVWSKCGHCGHVNLVMIFFILSRCRLTPIKQRLMVMVQNLCWLCGADILMPNRVEMSPRGFIVQGFAKILFLQEKVQKKSLHRSALLGWEVTRRINVAKMCFLFYFIISNLHHDVMFANMETVKNQTFQFKQLIKFSSKLHFR